MIKENILSLNKTSITFYILFFLAACQMNNNSTQKENKEQLGRHLFFDKNLSINHSRSCGSCHDPLLAFTDGYRTSVSALGENLLHNAPSLLNTQSYIAYDWANPAAHDYIGQMQRPLYAHNPIELGLNLHWNEVQKHLEKDSTYQQLFKTAFDKGKNKVTQANIHDAIATYLSTLKATNTAYHRYTKGDTNALSVSAKKGLKLFESTTLKCSKCHPAPYFTLNDTSNRIKEIYTNTGLYNLDDKNSYPINDNGLYAITKKKEDDGKFKIPSLINVSITSPYMHDGSIQTLDEVLEVYAQGGRKIIRGPQKGDGTKHANKNKNIQGFELTPEDKIHLINFLNSLTDTSYLRNENFLNPFRLQESNSNY